MNSRWAAVIVAAGRGDRLGAGGPKALVPVAGRALVAYAVDAVLQAGPAAIVIVHTPGQVEIFQDAVGAVGPVTWVEGGETRNASVRAGLAAVQAPLVAIHDAARAFCPPSVIRATTDAVTGDVIAAAPALPVADTLKRVNGAEVVTTVPRENVVRIQTPQAFNLEVLASVLDGSDHLVATDELSMVEAARDAGDVQGRIMTVPGSHEARKVTYPEDLRFAEMLVKGRA